MKRVFEGFGLAACAALLVAVTGWVVSCGESPRQRSESVASTGISITTPVLKRVSSWDVQTVDTLGDVGLHTSIDFDPADGEPAIVLS